MRLTNDVALADIQAHLRRDGHAATLAKIPPRIFYKLHDNIIINLRGLCGCDDGFSPAFAFFLDDRLHFDVQTEARRQRLMSSQECLDLVYLIEPFAELPLKLLRGSQDQVVAMLEYYLLVCVVDNKYLGSTPIPRYSPLRHMFKILEQNRPRQLPLATSMGSLSVNDARESRGGEEASHNGTAEGSSGRVESPLRPPVTGGVTPEVTETSSKNVESAAPEALTNPNNNSPNYRPAQPDKTDSEAAPMRPLKILEQNLLGRIRADVGRDMLKYLPKVVSLEWKKDTTDKDYVPLRLRLASFKKSSKEFTKKHSAWAFFKNRPNSSLELYVYDGNDDPIDDGALVSLEDEHIHLDYAKEFGMIRDREDVLEITRYFFLLAAEAADEDKYGLIRIDFKYTKNLTKRLLAMCQQLRDQAPTRRPDSPSIMQGGGHTSAYPATGQTTDDEQDMDGRASPGDTDVSAFSDSLSTHALEFEEGTASPDHPRSPSPESSSYADTNDGNATPPTTAAAQHTSPHVRVLANHVEDAEDPQDDELGDDELDDDELDDDELDDDELDDDKLDDGELDDDKLDDGELDDDKLDDGELDEALLGEVSSEVSTDRDHNTGYSTESSDGESVIHFLPPEQRNEHQDPEAIALEIELKCKLSNLKEAIKAQEDLLSDTEENKKNLERKMRKLIKKNAERWMIQDLQVRVGMLDERLKTFDENIRVFEKRRKEALWQSRWLKRQKGKS